MQPTLQRHLSVARSAGQRQIHGTQRRSRGREDNTRVQPTDKVTPLPDSPSSPARVHQSGEHSAIRTGTINALRPRLWEPDGEAEDPQTHRSPAARVCFESETPPSPVKDGRSRAWLPSSGLQTSGRHRGVVRYCDGGLERLAVGEVSRRRWQGRGGGEGGRYGTSGGGVRVSTGGARRGRAGQLSLSQVTTAPGTGGTPGRANWSAPLREEIMWQQLVGARICWQGRHATVAANFNRGVKTVAPKLRRSSQGVPAVGFRLHR